MKKFLVISLALLMSFSIVACSKKEEPDINEEHNYAENTVLEQTETEEPEVTDAIEATTTTETDATEEQLELEFHDMIYNTSDDVHMNDIIDMNAIAIDSKVIAFPCDYSYLIEKFGSFYIEQTLKYTTMIDVTGEEVGTSFEVYANPTTGDGDIMFKFASEDGSEVPISQMKCTGFRLSGGNYEGTKVMTCALPNWISFGSSIDEIYDYFGQKTESNSYSKDGGANFMLFYSLDDINLKFVGYDNGIHTIEVDYK